MKHGSWRTLSDYLAQPPATQSADAESRKHGVVQLETAPTPNEILNWQLTIARSVTMGCSLRASTPQHRLRFVVSQTTVTWQNVNNAWAYRDLRYAKQQLDVHMFFQSDQFFYSSMNAIGLFIQYTVGKTARENDAINLIKSNCIILLGGSERVPLNNITCG